MRISYLAATTLALGFSAISPSAFASCGGTTCGSNASHTNHTSQAYSGSNHHSSHNSSHHGSSAYVSASNCPSGTSPSPDGSCLVNANSSSVFTSGHASHSYGSSHGVSNNGTSYGGAYTGNLRSYRSTTGRAYTGSMSGAQAHHRYGSGSISGSYTSGSHTIVPFSTNTSNMSSHRIAGMGANESLTPTRCPVSVYNPNGGKVLGCYSVSKPAPVKRIVRKTIVHNHIQIVRPAPIIHTVRVVRPIIYVRYPVPIAVPVPVYQPRPVPNYGYHQNYGYQQNTSTCAGGYSARYGQQWPGKPCGW